MHANDDRRRHWMGYVIAGTLVLVMTGVGWPLHRRLGVANTNILMLYLLAVLWIATRYARGAAILASVLGVLAFDLVFVPPYYRLTVYDPQYLVTFGAMLLTALVISALTHRVRMHAGRAKAAWERVEAEYLRNTLLSGVSHELRTPLSAITGAASALIETGTNLPAESQREMLDTIYSESERMERLINNLLDMTRLESGGLVLHKEWTPLQEVIGSTLNHLDRRMHGRAITTELPADLPLVEIDAVAIDQVLTNLLDNAIQYTPAATAIELSAHANDGAMTIDVADRGPGLTPGMEDRVFQKFFRIQEGDNRRGIGLGLAISRGIVEAHGGKIVGLSRPGGGAVFRVTLPLTGAPPDVHTTE